MKGAVAASLTSPMYPPEIRLFRSNAKGEVRERTV